MAIYFPSTPATFIHILKNGGSSIEDWAYQAGIEYEMLPEHCDLATARTLVPNTGIIFTTVRNPYDRIVSQYHYVKQLLYKDMSVEDKIKHDMVFNKGFGYYVDCLYSNNFPFKQLGPHSVLSWWSLPKCQLDWFDTAPDIVLRLETIYNDFEQIKKLLGANNPLIHRSKTVRDSYRDYYTDDIRKKVYSMYQKDIEEFKYEF